LINPHDLGLTAFAGNSVNEKTSSMLLENHWQTLRKIKGLRNMEKTLYKQGEAL
jgi:hypothetical protein